MILYSWSVCTGFCYLILIHVIVLEVDWGGSSMIEAERILLGNALKDPSNVRFVFVSDR